MSPPNESQCVDVPCPTCHDVGGCDDCGGRGTFRLTECPHKTYYDRETAGMVRACEWLKKGMPPVAGGMRDQSQFFMAWCEEWDREVAGWNAGKPGVE